MGKMTMLGRMEKVKHPLSEKEYADTVERLKKQVAEDARNGVHMLEGVLEWEQADGPIVIDEDTWEVVDHIEGPWKSLGVKVIGTIG